MDRMVEVENAGSRREQREQEGSERKEEGQRGRRRSVRRGGGGECGEEVAGKELGGGRGSEARQTRCIAERWSCRAHRGTKA